MLDAIKECEDFVAKWPRENLIELLGIIKNELTVIYHQINDEASVYKVFEVLNSRGLDVKWLDKLKSKLLAAIFDNVKDDSQSEHINTMKEIWKSIYRKIGLKENIGDEALRFAGTLMHGEEQKRLLSEEKAVMLLSEKAGDKISNIIAVGNFLKDVVFHLYDVLDDPRREAVTKISQARFLATSIKLCDTSDAEKAELLEIWESLTFKIYGLFAADSRYKVGDFIKLGYDLYSKKLNTVQIKDGLNKIGDDKDYDIKNIINDNDWWKNSYKSWTDELRYLFYRYDEYLSRELGQEINEDQWRKIWSKSTKDTIEHILPQSSKKDYVHDLGNLTILSPKANSKLSNKKPIEKAEYYKSIGLTSTNRLGQEIEKLGGWRKADIMNRRNKILEFIKHEWG